MLVNTTLDFLLIGQFALSVGHYLSHKSAFIIFQDVFDVFEDLVHVLVVVVFEGSHCLFCLAFFKVVHFELVVVQEFEVVIDFDVALFAGFDEFTDSIGGVFVGGTVGVVEGVGEL